MIVGRFLKAKMRRIALIVFLPLFFACVSMSPVLGERETRPGVFSAIENVSPLWQPLAADSEEKPAILYFAGITKEPRLEFWALKAELGDPRLRLVISGPEKDLPFGSVYSTHVTGFVKTKNCLAGINTNPFDKVSAKEGEERKIAGLSVSDGVIVSPADPAFDAIVFYRDGGAAIVSQAEIGDLQNVENAAGGFGMVLKEGRIPERVRESQRYLRRHPRSAAGLSNGGKTLFLLVVDGRRPGSAGATEAELGLLLKQLGAEWGLNFDGGGSSVLALRFPDGRVRAVNMPIHNYIPGWERGVASCLGLKSNT
ncbi:MAG: phosphodiester glycosidase family protein [Treponema sp.]|jgi:hypothetical protein|nr:phosphodiester glycosidase family protein [Treponema sp.]